MSAIKELIEAAKEHPPGISRGGRLGSLAQQADLELTAMKLSHAAMFERLKKAWGPREKGPQVLEDVLHVLRHPYPGATPLKEAMLHERLADQLQVLVDGLRDELMLMHEEVQWEQATVGQIQAALGCELAEQQKTNFELARMQSKQSFADGKLEAAFEEATSKDKFSVSNDWPRLQEAFVLWMESRR